jgi:hypothetical protein
MPSLGECEYLGHSSMKSFTYALKMITLGNRFEVLMLCQSKGRYIITSNYEQCLSFYRTKICAKLHFDEVIMSCHVRVEKL